MRIIPSVGPGQNPSALRTSARRTVNRSVAAQIAGLDEIVVSDRAVTGPTDTEAPRTPDEIIQDIGSRLLHNAQIDRDNPNVNWLVNPHSEITDQEMEQFYSALAQVTGSPDSPRRRNTVQAFLQSIADGLNIDPGHDKGFTINDLKEAWKNPKVITQDIRKQRKSERIINRLIHKITDSIIKNNGDFSKVDQKLFTKLAKELDKLTGVHRGEIFLKELFGVLAYPPSPIDGGPARPPLNISGLRNLNLESVVSIWLNGQIPFPA